MPESFIMLVAAAYLVSFKGPLLTQNSADLAFCFPS